MIAPAAPWWRPPTRAAASGRSNLLRPHLPEDRAVLDAVKAASRRLRRWPAANLDRACARRSANCRSGRRDGPSRSNKGMMVKAPRPSCRTRRTQLVHAAARADLSHGYRDNHTGLDQPNQILATSGHPSGTQSRANRRVANPGRVRLEPLVAISWNDWSPSAGSAGRHRWNPQIVSCNTGAGEHVTYDLFDEAICGC